MSGERVAWLQAWPQSTFAPAAAWAWVGRPAQVPAPASPLAAAPADLSEADRRAPSRREAFLQRRRLACRFAAALTGTPPGNVAIVAVDGRPVLQPPLDVFSLSLSHRDGWLGLALSRRPVGIDVESVGAAREPAWAMLSPSERDGLRPLESAARWRAFLALWTAKEAYLKALGVGLFREPSEIAVDVRGEAMRLTDRGLPVATVAAQRMGSEAIEAACVVLPAR